MSVLKTENLTKYYGNARGIENVNLEVNEGEVFGFIGPNGAGKSTTIRTLLALIHPTSGSGSIFGKDCIEYSKEIAKDIGYLPSEVFYYDNMRVKDLLKYSASFYKKDCKERINELCTILELDPDKKIDDLSFGNRKKVGIVQGLLHSPKLIILDEPTSGLDPLMQQKFFEIIQQENKKGATVFFSSHILSEVQKLCDRVAIIKEGKIIRTERISELRENSYKKITCETQSTIGKDYFNFDGVNKLNIIDNNVSFIYKGNIDFIMKKLAALSLLNINIEEPDLEEIFMHYYNT